MRRAPPSGSGPLGQRFVESENRNHLTDSAARDPRSDAARTVLFTNATARQ
jgi:hypothetical protein